MYKTDFMKVYCPKWIINVLVFFIINFSSIRIQPTRLYNVWEALRQYRGNFKHVFLIVKWKCVFSPAWPSYTQAARTRQKSKDYAFYESLRTNYSHVNTRKHVFNAFKHSHYFRLFVSIKLYFYRRRLRFVYVAQVDRQL